MLLWNIGGDKEIEKRKKKRKKLDQWNQYLTTKAENMSSTMGSETHFPRTVSIYQILFDSGLTHI